MQSNNKKTQDESALSYPIRMSVLGLDSASINGKLWFTASAYLREMRLSPKSVQTPYLHVKLGKADCLDVFGSKLFRPTGRGSIG